MEIYKSDLYIDDLKYVKNKIHTWEKLENKSILISGATGQIGSFIIDVIMYMNNTSELNCTVYAVGRSLSKLQKRFTYLGENKNLKFIEHDINYPLKQTTDIASIDFVMHLASNTHPLLYSGDPIGTITTNIIGTKNMLDFAYTYKAQRCVFASSVEVYGENRGDVELFNEDYAGYLNCNTLRAGYPESKRCGEALCQAYIKQKQMDIVIPRIARTYGPTLQESDSKALSQFLKKGIAGEDIVLKSQGNQYYSYTYIADVVYGIFLLLFCGKTGEAYNISDESGDIKLKELAGLIADKCGQKVIFEIPDDFEKAGYSTATTARMDSSKIRLIGWKAGYSISFGISKTIDMLKQ